jgi:hypothetical protein
MAIADFPIGSAPIGGVVISPGISPASDPIKYYTGLITSQYQNSQKFMAWVESIVTKIEDINFLARSMYSAFDLDMATGAQLDILGQTIGISRTLVSKGYGGIGYMPSLSDDDYRLVLKARVALNSWDGKKDSLQTIWQELFPFWDLMISDTQYMDMWVTLVSSSPRLDLETFLFNGKIIPQPEGIGIYYFRSSHLAVFGFDMDNSFVTGLDDGNWATSVITAPPAFGFDFADNFVNGLDSGYWL